MIPCKECLLIPLCKQKTYQDLLSSCSTLHETLYYQSYGHGWQPIGIYHTLMKELVKKLNPTLWTVTEEGYIRFREGV